MKMDPSVKSAYTVAMEMGEKAYAPYSKFHVGAAVVTRDQKIFSGCNVENASYGATVCAERVAMWKAASEGHHLFTDVVVVTRLENPAVPCALCLQVMAEFCTQETRIWVGNHKEIKLVKKFSEILPLPFGPKQLQAT